MRKLLNLDRQQVIELYQSPLSTLDVAKRLGASAEAIRKKLIEWGIPRHPQAKSLDHPYPGKSRPMEKNGAWKGGRQIDKDGYVLLKSNDHPHKNSGGYVREHRLVMEAHLGRYLTADEVIHHRDEDKKNNKLNNLVLYKKNSDHLSETIRGQNPKWTEEGKRKIKEGLKNRRLYLLSSLPTLKICADRLQVSLFRLRTKLNAEGKYLLRKALWQGKDVDLPLLEKEHGKGVTPWLSELQSN